MSVYARRVFCATPGTGKARSASSRTSVSIFGAARVIWAPCISRDPERVKRRGGQSPPVRRWPIHGRITIPIHGALAPRDQQQQRPRDLFVLRDEPTVERFPERDGFEVPRRPEPALAQRAASQFDPAPMAAYGAFTESPALGVASLDLEDVVLGKRDARDAARGARDLLAGGQPRESIILLARAAAGAALAALRIRSHNAVAASCHVVQGRPAYGIGRHIARAAADQRAERD